MITVFDEDAARRISATVRAHERKSPLRTARGKTLPLLGQGATAKAELIGATAIIVGTVPAASDIDATGPITEGQQVATFGELDPISTANTITAGALLVNPDGTALYKDGSLYVVKAINPSYTAFEDSGTGVGVSGTLADINGEEVFVLPWNDLRAMPNHQTGTAPLGGDDPDMQVIFHQGGEDNYQASPTNDCEAP